MKITHVAEIVKSSHVAEIVKLTHVARILEAGSMYDLCDQYFMFVASYEQEKKAKAKGRKNPFSPIILTVLFFWITRL